jgi:uncharacterized protein YfaS (alpha-2-macroglobulin family)
MSPLRTTLLAVAISPLLAQGASVNRPAPGAFPETDAAAYSKTYDEAVATGKWDAAVKALVLKLRAENQKLDEGEGAVLRAMDKAAASAPAGMRAPLLALLARQYRAYHDAHRYELANRTAGGSGDKLEGWDATRFLREVDKRFADALAEEPALRAIPIATYSEITDKGKDAPGDAARPTLFDFLAYDAVEHYTRTDRFGEAPENSPYFAPDSPLLGDTDEFLAWRPAGDDAPTRAIALLQRLTRAHRNDPEAFAEAELVRLRWARRAASGIVSTMRIRKQLTVLAEKFPESGAAPFARAEIAEMWIAEGNPKAARAEADKGRALRPGSPGAARCENLVREIETPDATLKAERVWNSPWPRITVVHKNLSKITFRVVRWDWKDFLGANRGRPEWLNDNEKAAVLAGPTVKSWTENLPATPDYKLRTDRLPVPEDLAPGFYFLVASFDDDFSVKNNRVLYTDFWVSKLAVVVEGTTGNRVIGRVCDAATGEPIAGASVTGWQLQDRRERAAVGETVTDANGAFTLNPPGGRGLLLLARTPDGQELGSMQEFAGMRDPRPATPHNRVTFFTDRAIYRPGQSAKFKGVVLRADPAELKHRPISGRKVTVVLDDANGKEVAKLQVLTNDYGAFDGAFEIPRDRLPGTYTLHTTGNENGRNYFQVEEYKRPTFEVKLASVGSELARAPTATPASGLPTTVTITGTATNYTDAPVDGAKVVWRVTKQEVWPMWCWWRPSTPPQQIAQGEGVTDASGKFTVKFESPEAPAGRHGESPVSTYTVTADVTDNAGETRAGSRDILVGRVDRIATVDSEAKPGEYAVNVTNLDGEPVAEVAGKLVIRRLKEPAYVHRKPLESDTGFRHQGHISRLGKHARGGVLESIGDEEAEDDSGVPRDRIDLSNPINWEAEEIVAELPFTTDAKGVARVKVANLKPGHYRAFVETKDSSVKPVVARGESRVLPESGDKLTLKVPFVVEADRERDYQPGDEFGLRWGTGYDSGRALVEIFRRNKPTETFWTAAGKTLADIRVPVTEADRGGLSVSVSQIRENRLYHEETVVKVPWSDKMLSLNWEHFTDKLKPGAPETWTAIVRGPDVKPVTGEVVATLYDASLDAYRPLDWPADFGLWPSFNHYRNAGFLNLEKGFRWMRGEWARERLPDEDPRRVWSPELAESNQGPILFARNGMMRKGGMAMMESAKAAPMAMMAADASAAPASAAPEPARPTPSLDSVSPRKNLQETAFFMPTVKVGEDGVARFEFTVPQALTRWRLLAFAHDKQLRTGKLEASAVTALDLMVKPNPPRFLREGDSVELPVKLLNRSDKPITGTARLSFDDAGTKRPMDTELGNTATEKSFTIPAKGSVALAWRVIIPDGCGPLAYTVKAAAASGDTDGEAGMLPVLARRIPVTESKAAALIGPGEVRVKLDNLAGSAASDTLRSTSLRVDTVARPSWYAVMALPYLMEFPHECAEQLFHRYYANALAHHIASSDPKLRATFDAWKGTDALDSPLEKNADIKGLLLEETPWVREAASESAQRRQVGVLFDDARLTTESTKALRKLDERRGPDGGWSWFPGGESSPWVSRTIVLGIGRLGAMGVPTDAQVAINALPVLDKSIRKRFEELKEHDGRKDYTCDADIAHTLHARSYFLSEAPIPGESKEAYAFFVERAKTGWTALDRASQARLALCLPKFGDNGTPALIVKSLRERAVTGGDKGMRWNDAPALGWWRPWVAPVETQALMVEVFESVAKDPVAADACRLALLANKRTNAWGTTTATADSCYALLMRGNDWLAGDAGCAVTVGGKALTPEKIEAGTGAASVSLPTKDITPASADIVVKKSESGPAWVSAHWSYLEDAGKVKDSNQAALSVKKTLWKKVITKTGPQLLPVSGNKVNVGDELVVRLEVTNDRDLEFVHIKDGRPACVEPGIVISGYKWTTGLGYYETVRDTATHRFVESMPKGTHVFEFSARADRRGVCGAGLSEVRCMYAPEFAAHGGAPAVTVE